MVAKARESAKRRCRLGRRGFHSQVALEAVFLDGQLEAATSASVSGVQTCVRV